MLWQYGVIGIIIGYGYTNIAADLMDLKVPHNRDFMPMFYTWDRLLRCFSLRRHPSRISRSLYEKSLSIVDDWGGSCDPICHIEPYNICFHALLISHRDFNPCVRSVDGKKSYYIYLGLLRKAANPSSQYFFPSQSHFVSSITKPNINISLF